MGLMDEIRKLTPSKRYSETPDDEFYDEYDDEPMEEESAPPHARPTYTTRGAAAAAPSPMDTGRPSASHVVNINPASNLQMIVIKPDRFAQATDIASHLLNKQAIVLNLESTNKDVARRLVDFLSGCAHALDGHIEKVAISTYLVTPYNVEVVGDNAKEPEDFLSYQ